HGPQRTEKFFADAPRRNICPESGTFREEPARSKANLPSNEANRPRPCSPACFDSCKGERSSTASDVDDRKSSPQPRRALTDLMGLKERKSFSPTHLAATFVLSQGRFARNPPAQKPTCPRTRQIGRGRALPRALTHARGSVKVRPPMSMIASHPLSPAGREQI